MPNALSSLAVGDEIVVAAAFDGEPELLELEVIDRDGIRYINWVYARLVDGGRTFRITASKDSAELEARIAEADPDEELDVDDAMESDGVPVIGLSSGPTDHVLADVQAWLARRLSAAETLDYSAVILTGRLSKDWAEERDISHQAVSENVRKAIANLEQQA